MKKKRKPTVRIVWFKRPTNPPSYNCPQCKQANLNEFDWIDNSGEEHYRLHCVACPHCGFFQDDSGEVQNYVKCWKCSSRYQPKAEDLKRWAESGQPFDPTDWECPSCEALEGEPSSNHSI